MPPRTNACGTCRKKRIKCDLTTPSCLMCQKFNRICPGPSKGPIFIDMTNQAAKKPKATSKTIPQPNSLVQTFDADPHLSDEMEWGFGTPISQRNALAELFFDRFLIYFTSDGESADIRNRQTWLHHLPTMSVDGTNSALPLALYAAASAFSGIKTRNLALLQDACSIYGAALQSHGKIIEKSTKKVGARVTAHMVSTSVLLSLFEAMNATSSEAYWGHISGAARMVQLVGIEQCMYGSMCQLYFHIRTQMTFIYLTTPKSSYSQIRESIPAERILHENLSYDKLPIFQRLVSLVIQLSELYIHLDDEDQGEQQVQQQESTHPTSPPSLIPLQTFLQLKESLQNLYTEFASSSTSPSQPLQHYTTPFSALTLSFFSVAHILLQILAPRLSATYPLFTDPYQQILHAASYLNVFKAGFAYMRMATPLYLVSVHAPDKQQRRNARMYFEKWKGIGMGGISALAVESMKRSINKRRVTTEDEGGDNEVGVQMFPTMNLCEGTRTMEKFADGVRMQIQGDTGRGLLDWQRVQWIS